MKVVFLDMDGVMTDDYLINYEYKHRHENNNQLFMLEDKFVTLKKIVDKYDLKVVISSSWKCGIEYYEADGEETVIDRVKEVFNKYDIPYIGTTPCVPNPNFRGGQEMWTEYDIQAYLIEHPEVTDYVIFDDHEYHDLNTLNNHLIETSYNEDGLGHGGILPHHIEDVQYKLKPRENYTPEEMKENELYKKIKYSEFNFIDGGIKGLFLKTEDFVLNIQLTFDKKSVIFHIADENEGDTRGTFYTYEDFINILCYLNIVKKEVNQKTLSRRC